MESAKHVIVKDETGKWKCLCGTEYSEEEMKVILDGFRPGAKAGYIKCVERAVNP